MCPLEILFAVHGIADGIFTNNVRASLLVSHLLEFQTTIPTGLVRRSNPFGPGA